MAVELEAVNVVASLSISVAPTEFTQLPRVLVIGWRRRQRDRHRDDRSGRHTPRPRSRRSGRLVPLLPWGALPTTLVSAPFALAVAVALTVAVAVAAAVAVAFRTATAVAQIHASRRGATVPNRVERVASFRRQPLTGAATASTDVGSSSRVDRRSHAHDRSSGWSGNDDRNSGDCVCGRDIRMQLHPLHLENAAVRMGKFANGTPI